MEFAISKEDVAESLADVSTRTLRRACKKFPKTRAMFVEQFGTEDYPLIKQIDGWQQERLEELARRGK